MAVAAWIEYDIALQRLQAGCFPFDTSSSGHWYSCYWQNKWHGVTLLGRGIQPPSTPMPPPTTNTYLKRSFLVAESQRYKRLCLSGGLLVYLLVCPSHSSWKCEKRAFMVMMLQMFYVSERGVWGWVGVRLGVGCPCPPVLASKNWVNFFFKWPFAP